MSESLLGVDENNDESKDEYSKLSKEDHYKLQDTILAAKVVNFDTKLFEYYAQNLLRVAKQKLRKAISATMADDICVSRSQSLRYAAELANEFENSSNSM